MHPILQLILQAYAMEGIKAADVAMLVTRENYATVYRCMSPQQHHAARAQGVKKRLQRWLVGESSADCEVQPGQVITEACTETMHTLVVHYHHRQALQS